jgi:hypothetical protein
MKNHFGLASFRSAGNDAATNGHYLPSSSQHLPPKIKTPAGVQPAGAKVRINESLSASGKNHSMITQKIKTPAKDDTKAGATGVVVDNRSSIASENRNSTFGCFDANPRMRIDPEM